MPLVTIMSLFFVPAARNGWVSLTCQLPLTRFVFSSLLLFSFIRTSVIVTLLLVVLVVSSLQITSIHFLYHHFFFCHLICSVGFEYVTVMHFLLFSSNFLSSWYLKSILSFFFLFHITPFFVFLFFKSSPINLLFFLEASYT